MRWNCKIINRSYNYACGAFCIQIQYLQPWLNRCILLVPTYLINKWFSLSVPHPEGFSIVYIAYVWPCRAFFSLASIVDRAHISCVLSVRFRLTDWVVVATPCCTDWVWFSIFDLNGFVTNAATSPAVRPAKSGGLSNGTRHKILK